LAEFRAPSFTWASVDVPVELSRNSRWDIAPGSDAKLLGHRSGSLPNDVFGPVAGGEITLRGRCMQLADVPKSSSQSDPDRDSLPPRGEVWGDQLGLDNERGALKEKLVVLSLRIRESNSEKEPRTQYGLLLHPTELEGQFYRVGLYVDDSWTEQDLATREERDVTIL